jgi:membrane fusion protein
MPLAPDSITEFLDPEPPHWAVRGLGWLTIGIALAGAMVVSIVSVPDTVRGRFVLTPVGGADPVRARKEGIVTEVRIREGDPVAAGAPLVMVQSSSMTDRSGDQRAVEAQREAGEERLRLAASQYETRLRGDQAEERRLQARIESLSRMVASKRGRYALTRELADSALSGLRRGLFNRLEAARLDLEAATLAEEVEGTSGELHEARADLARLRHEAEARTLEYRQTRRSIEGELETARIRIDALGRDLRDLGDTGLVLSAPCTGTVLRVQVQGPGTVVQEGDVLFEVACAGMRLRAEVEVPQSGLPLLRPGQAVKLRYDAFPYQRFGVRLGRVQWVGPAGESGGRDSTRFRAFLALSDDSIPVQGELRALQVGMGGQADVVVGRRTLLSLAIEPVRALQESMSTPR